jgi:metallophosphoesterase superfamily enzyme
MMRILDDWLLLPQRFAVHEPSATAVLADVHLGYSAARQRLGDAIPWRSVEEEMEPLVIAAGTHDIRAVIVAGDLFERGFDAALCRQWLDVLHRLKIRFAGLVPGNHDFGFHTNGTRSVPATRAPLPLFPNGYDLAGWRIRHGDKPSEDEKAVTGHWHPALRRKGRKVPCFLTRGQHLILPAFSLDAAGVDVHSETRWRGWDCYALCGTQIKAQRIGAGA